MHSMAGNSTRFTLAFVVYGLNIDLGCFEPGVMKAGLFESGEKRRLAKCATLACNFAIIMSLLEAL